jgi:hypothetical protein
VEIASFSDAVRVKKQRRFADGKQKQIPAAKAGIGGT